MKWKEPYKLEKLQYNVKFEVNKIFSNNQLQEISNNPLQAWEIFRKNLLEWLRRYPEAILWRNLINELQQWLSKEDIKWYIEQAKIRAPLHLLQNFNELWIYYNNQEKKEIVLEFSNSDPDSVFATFKKPEIHLLFTKNERRKILLQCVEKWIWIFCDKEKIEEYEKSLFISKDDVKNIVLLLI